MSKSIYEEALNNTQILLALVNVKDLISKKKYDLLTQVEQALEQAQKQKKLLQLYKKWASVRYDMLNNNNSHKVDFERYYNNLEKEKDLIKQIKELENEKIT